MKYYTSTTEYNCGIDLHARQMYVCVMDRQGKKLVHTNVLNNDFKYFLKLVEPYKHDLTVCCECMFGWYWLADACQPFVDSRTRRFVCGGRTNRGTLAKVEAAGNLAVVSAGTTRMTLAFYSA